MITGALVGILLRLILHGGQLLDEGVHLHGVESRLVFLVPFLYRRRLILTHIGDALLVLAGLEVTLAL